LIESGEVSKLLPTWNPWWSYSVPKKLIEEIDNIDNDKTYKQNCPKILSCSPFKSISVSDILKLYFLII
jgi:hypothetical protein